MGYYKPCTRDIRRGQWYGENPNWGPNGPAGHNGGDLLAPVGTPVYAAGDGEVIWVGQFDDTYIDNFGWGLNYGGLQIVLNLDGPEGPYVEYGHLSEAFVKVGDRVRGAQLIAKSGKSDGGTGVITGPHLHVGTLPPGFDVNTPSYGRVNPDMYLTEYPEDAGTITVQSAAVAPAPVEQPKEWDEMASEAQIEDIVRRVVWGGPNGTMIHNYRLGRGEWPQTIVGAFEGRMQNEILPAVVVGPLQQQLGGMSAKIDALATALAAKPDNPLTKEEALAQLDASVKASFGEYTPVLVKTDTVPEGAPANG
ncbi:MAG TPA: M23 family metallopeptidase [Arthrobacter sp.]